ncbi:MAG: phosphoadenylyl-sulfate reductase [Pseudomonadota bacterium]
MSSMSLRPQIYCEASALGQPSLDEQADALCVQYKGQSAEEILTGAVRESFAGRIALVSSFGAESVVLLHLISQIDPYTPVIFLDTEKHFAQTLSYRKKLAARFGLKSVIDIHPEATEKEAEDPDGTLWRRDADGCCSLRKVRPLKNALGAYDAWITGRKQFHGGERIQLPIFDAAEPHIKVNPLVTWTPDDVATYIKLHDLPPHPLVAQGYPSIGCWPCTHPVTAGEDARAGRWRGAAKTECGIHGRD